MQVHQALGVVEYGSIVEGIGSDAKSHCDFSTHERKKVQSEDIESTISKDVVCNSADVSIRHTHTHTHTHTMGVIMSLDAEIRMARDTGSAKTSKS